LLGWLKSKYDKNSSAGKLAAKYGWSYEGGKEWSCSVPDEYVWRGRETAVDSEGSARMLKFKAAIVGSEALGLQIATSSARISHELPRALTSNDAFDEQLLVAASASAFVTQVLLPDAIEAWLQWPQARPGDFTLSLSGGYLNIQLLTRGFINNDEPEKYLLFCDSISRRISESVSIDRHVDESTFTHLRL
jgi:hypothetical protein